MGRTDRLECYNCIALFNVQTAKWHSVASHANMDTQMYGYRHRRHYFGIVVYVS